MANSIPSSPIYAAPAASADTPSVALAAMVNSVYSILLNSSNMLAWIQSYGGGSTAGRVLQGYDPDRFKPSNLRDNGPVAFISYLNDLQDGNSGKAALGDVTIEIDFLWYEDPDTAHTHITELNYYGKVRDELAIKGVPLNDTYGGHISHTDGAKMPKGKRRNVEHARVQVIVVFGNNPAA